MAIKTNNILLLVGLFILTIITVIPFIECNNTWKEADSSILSQYEMGIDDWSAYPSGDAAEIDLIEFLSLLTVFGLWGVVTVIVWKDGV